MLDERLKINHTQGVVAKVKWVPVDNGMGYSGIYAEGTKFAILRFSQTTNLTENSKGLFPSLAIKFLLDEDISLNLFGMPNFTGTESWDFFSQTFKSRVAPFTEEKHPIQKKTILQKNTEGDARPYATAVCNPAEWSKGRERL